MSQSGTSQPTENLVDKLTVIAKNALVNWDLQGAELELIKYRENAVYKITDKTGKKFALRVHRLNYHSDAALQAECDWTASLTQYGISTPPVIDTNSGQCFAIVTGQGIEPRQCDLLGWVEGDPMGSIEEGVEGDIETLKRTYLWCLNRLFRSSFNLLIGVLSLIPLCGRCQLYMWLHPGKA